MDMEYIKEDLVELDGSDRGGVIQGYTPVHSHVQLYLVQIILIMVLCFVLGQVMKKWNQPRVIAEVMAGVLLGPSALGAIPGFTSTLFPDDSLEPLTLTAHLGLILFLFIVGLELDPALLQSNAKKATILSLTGQGVTWVLSLGVSRAMITWMDDVESTTSFVLFIGVSLSVTAFPVLSRILGENSLLNTNVGALVISAASVDEACVWCLLALVVSTVNAGSPLDAFYVFLLLLFFMAVMLTVVRKALLMVVRMVPSEQSGAPSRGVVILCLLLTLVAAWVTDFIGIDAIFGAFVAGIIVPRENSLHVRIVELVQDVVSVLLLPLYFAVSGLKTDLTLLDNATSWAICALTICAACLGKIGGGASVARIFGMNVRESMAVGVLMNTRGLVELIILNIGLDAGVLTEEVMAIMVVMALVTTFLTAPLSSIVYPPKYHTLPGRKRRRRASEESAASKNSLTRALSSIPEIGVFAQERLTLMVLITNPSALDAVTRIARLFSGNQPARKKEPAGGPGRRKGGSSGPVGKGDEVVVHALRLVENTDRFTSDMRALEKGETLTKDGMAGILQGFLDLLMIKVMTHVSVGTQTDFCRDVTRLTDEHGISTVVFPWDARTAHRSTQLTRVEKLMETTQSQFVLAFNCHTALVVSGGLSLLVPFFGGDDDTAALLLALAILERDSSAELVILSFLGPENRAASAAEQGAVGNGSGGNGSGNNNGAAAATAGGASAPPLSGDDRPRGDTDLEAGAPAVQPTPIPGNGTTPTAAATASDAGGGGNGTSTGAKGNGNGNGNGAKSSSWSPHEFVARAEGLARVRVTRAWSLNAALGARSAAASAAAAADAAANPESSEQQQQQQQQQQSNSAAAGIVQEVVEARSIGLVLCGCAGSTPQRQGEDSDNVDDSDVIAGNNPMFAGARSANPKGPSIASVGGLRSGSGASKNGPLSLMTRSWHGKSRHHARWSYRAARDAAFNSGGGSDRPGSGSRHGGGLASAVEEMINNALWDIVGDVAAVLLASEPAPAVLAVRASLPVTSL